jgi:hypothetical protein
VSHAETQPKRTNTERADNRDADDKNADNTGCFAVVDTRRTSIAIQFTPIYLMKRCGTTNHD